MRRRRHRLHPLMRTLVDDRAFLIIVAALILTLSIAVNL